MFRQYLDALSEFSTPTFDVDSPARGGVHGAGSRMGALRSWLLPDVLLGLSRDESVPLFLITRRGERIYATIEAIDAWLSKYERENVQWEIGKSLTLLQAQVSRAASPADQSRAHKALNVLRDVLVNSQESKPAA